MTLQRAKGMLEQSHVPIAGVVFNGLNEDIQNWSSYGYDGAPAGISARGCLRRGYRARTRAPANRNRTMKRVTMLAMAGSDGPLGFRRPRT